MPTPKSDVLDTKILQLQAELDALIKARDIIRGNALVVAPLQSGPYSAMLLTDACRDVVLKLGPMSAPEIARHIREGGIRSTSKNLAATVHQALLQATDFKKKDGLWHLSGFRG